MTAKDVLEVCGGEWKIGVGSQRSLERMHRQVQCSRSWEKVGKGTVWGDPYRSREHRARKKGAPALHLALQQSQVLERWMACCLHPRITQISCDHHSFSKYSLMKCAKIYTR